MPKTSRMLVCKLASLSIALVIGFLFLTPVANAQQYDSNLYSGLRWRLIGPFRGGRINAVSGVPGQPETFYYGSVGGGVWKTNNAGRTWNPIFDSANVSSKFIPSMVGDGSPSITGVFTRRKLRSKFRCRPYAALFRQQKNHPGKLGHRRDELVYDSSEKWPERGERNYIV